MCSNALKSLANYTITEQLTIAALNFPTYCMDCNGPVSKDVCLLAKASYHLIACGILSISA